MDLDMERAVDAGGLRSPPIAYSIGGAQRSEAAGEGGGGRILKFVFEIWIQGCKSWRS